MDYTKYGSLEGFMGSDEAIEGQLARKKDIMEEVGEITNQVLLALSYLEDNEISYLDLRPKVPMLPLNPHLIPSR